MCKEGLVEDEYHLLFTCSAYSAVCESYDDILRGGDDLHVTLKRIPRRLSSYVDALFTNWDFVLQVWISMSGRTHTSGKTCVVRSHRSILATLGTLKNI